jgi:hypothetical protein
MESQDENLDINGVIAAILGIQYTPSLYIKRTGDMNI